MKLRSRMALYRAADLALGFSLIAALLGFFVLVFLY